MRSLLRSCGLIGKLCECDVKVQHETPEKQSQRTENRARGQPPPQRCYYKVCSREHIFWVCHSSTSHYFYFHLSEGTVKLELPLTPQNSLFRAYYLNHWRYVGKTGHPIKPRKRPPVLTYSGGTESDSLWREHLCQIEGQWNGTGKVHDRFIVLFCPYSVDSHRFDSGGTYTINRVWRQNTSKP